MDGLHTDCHKISSDTGRNCKDCSISVLDKTKRISLRLPEVLSRANALTPFPQHGTRDTRIVGSAILVDPDLSAFIWSFGSDEDDGERLVMQEHKRGLNRRGSRVCPKVG